MTVIKTLRNPIPSLPEIKWSHPTILRKVNASVMVDEVWYYLFGPESIQPWGWRGIALNNGPSVGCCVPFMAKHPYGKNLGKVLDAWLSALLLVPSLFIGVTGHLSLQKKRRKRYS